MKNLGGNDYKQAHNNGKKRRRDIGASVDLTIDLNDYDSHNPDWTRSAAMSRSLPRYWAAVGK